MSDKATLRRALSQRRRALTDPERRERSARVQAQLLAAPLFTCAKSIALYRPMGNEVDTAQLHQAALEAGKQVAYPSVDGDDRGMRFLKVDRGTAWITHPRGFQVPHTDQVLSLDALELVVLPGLAFDPAGHRLGRGAGHYDRALAGLLRPKTIGLAYDFQMIDCVPADPWDVPVDAIVHERALCRATGRADR